MEKGIRKQRNILIVVILLLLAGVGYSINRSGNLKTKLAISNQNNKALSDTVRITKNKVGTLEYSKNVLVAEKRDIASLNTKLGQELDKEKGKVRELTHIVATIGNQPNDTIEITNTIIKHPNGVYGLAWEYDTIYDHYNSRHLAGESRFRYQNDSIVPLQTIITKDNINFNLVTGLRELDGNIEIFARSDNPNFGVIQLDGAIIDPKKHPVLKKFTKQKRWSVGPYAGVGIGSSLNLSIQLGVGVSYSIIRF